VVSRPLRFPLTLHEKPAQRNFVPLKRKKCSFLFFCKRALFSPKLARNYVGVNTGRILAVFAGTVEVPSFIEIMKEHQERSYEYAMRPFALRSPLHPAIFSSSPYVRYLGMQLLDIQPGVARLALPFTEELVTIGTIVHGGAIASLIDTPAMVAAWSDAEVLAKARGTTVNMTVS